MLLTYTRLKTEYLYPSLDWEKRRNDGKVSLNAFIQFFKVGLGSGVTSTNCFNSFHSVVHTVAHSTSSFCQVYDLFADLYYEDQPRNRRYSNVSFFLGNLASHSNILWRVREEEYLGSTIQYPAMLTWSGAMKKVWNIPTARSDHDAEVNFGLIWVNVWGARCCTSSLAGKMSVGISIPTKRL